MPPRIPKTQATRPGIDRWVPGTSSSSSNLPTATDQEDPDQLIMTSKELQVLLESRCNSLSTLTSELSTTEEGHFPAMEAYELALIQVLTRHGSRAPLKGIPLANFSSFRCPDGDEYLTDLNRSEMKKCSRGKLTWKGCRQHEALGRHIKTIYGLDPEEASSHMRVITTDYQRTIQSAKCFLNGLLGQRQYPTLRKAQGILFPDERTGYLSHCPSFDYAWQETQQGPKFERARKIWWVAKAEMKQFLGRARRRIKPYQGPVEFYEGLICHYCHLYGTVNSSSMTPCIRNECVSPSLVLQTIEAADMTTKLQNDETVSLKSVHPASFIMSSLLLFVQMALLQIQPFIAQILSNFKKWIGGSRAHDFILYSGHDTTVSAVLTALHAFDGHRPPYAARVIFELWKKKNEENYMVRTLYNGHVIKSDIISDLTDFGTFERHLTTGRLRSKQSHRAACIDGDF